MIIGEVKSSFIYIILPYINQQQFNYQIKENLGSHYEFMHIHYLLIRYAKSYMC